MRGAAAAGEAGESLGEEPAESAVAVAVVHHHPELGHPGLEADEVGETHDLLHSLHRRGGRHDEALAGIEEGEVAHHLLADVGHGAEEAPPPGLRRQPLQKGPYPRRVARPGQAQAHPRAVVQLVGGGHHRAGIGQAYRCSVASHASQVSRPAQLEANVA
jgi:hypothetical protein